MRQQSLRGCQLDHSDVVSVREVIHAVLAGSTCIVAGFAVGLDMAGFCVTGTSAPAASPGPSGGIEITCARAAGLYQDLLWSVLMMHRTPCMPPSVSDMRKISIASSSYLLCSLAGAALRLKRPLSITSPHFLLAR